MSSWISAAGVLFLLTAAALARSGPQELSPAELDRVRGSDLFGECTPTGLSCYSKQGNGCTGPADTTCVTCDVASPDTIYERECDGWLGLCYDWTDRYICGDKATGTCSYPPSGPGICTPTGSGIMSCNPIKLCS